MSITDRLHLKQPSQSTSVPKLSYLEAIVSKPTLVRQVYLNILGQEVL